MFVNTARQTTAHGTSFARIAAKHHRASRLHPRKYYSQHSAPRPALTGYSSRLLPIVTAAGATLLSLSYVYRGIEETHAEAPPVPVDVTFEKRKTKDKLSKEENRDRLSSQHFQIKKIREDPGVYVWGANSGRVAAPDSDETVIKTPRRISYFDGQLLRDVKLELDFGTAITENGDLVQWGKGYSPENFTPTKTLKGKDLVSISCSADRIIALSSNGTIYSLPVSKADQESGKKLHESSWIPFWASKSNLSYRVLQPRLGLAEKVTHISGGLEHALLLTNSGRVFSVTSCSEHYPSHGQLGVPGLAWSTRPEGPIDTCHELKTLKGTKVVKTASGDFHSLVLDKDGRVFVFGDNSSGQLGFDFDPQAPYLDTPTLLPLQSLYYSKQKKQAKVTNIAAGGSTSFLTADATRLPSPDEDPRQIRGLGQATADTWSFGRGLTGILGNGRWTHIQDNPALVKALSGLSEYDEVRQKIVPIRLSQISVGFTHAGAVMDNYTQLNASDRGSHADTNYGADAVWWGGNEFYQIGSGKRNNNAAPTYINPPADMHTPGDKEEHRFQIIPRSAAKVGGRKVTMEQRIECGRNVTAVYCAP